MYENPFDRKFGVEFEFNCSAIRNMTRRDTYGVAKSKTNVLREILEENGLVDFVVGCDGSEFEVKTPILQGPTGFKKMKRFLEVILDLGARTSLEADGLHVHHDAPEFYSMEDGYEREPVTNLVRNWYNVQSKVMDMVDDCRNNRWACTSWNMMEAQNVIERFEEYAPRMGRKNLNIAALRRHGTIEFRLHEGTLDYEEVLSWVRFGQSFIGKALESTETLEAATAIELVNKVNVSRNATRFLTRKIENKRPSFVSVEY